MECSNGWLESFLRVLADTSGNEAGKLGLRSTGNFLCVWLCFFLFAELVEDDAFASVDLVEFGFLLGQGLLGVCQLISFVGEGFGQLLDFGVFLSERFIDGLFARNDKGLLGICRHTVGDEGVCDALNQLAVL